jgi:hypothetical protein
MIVRTVGRGGLTRSALGKLAVALHCWCREGESNPHAPLRASDFKSDASANSAIPATIGMHEKQNTYTAFRAMIRKLALGPVAVLVAVDFRIRRDARW